MVIDPVPPEDIRVTNQERKNVTERLCRAHEEGSITVTEFDSRLGAAWEATTRGQLARLTADLPLERPRVLPRDDRAGEATRHPVLRTATLTWLAVSISSLVLWGLAGFATTELPDSWWLWIVGPAGAVLATMWLIATRNDPGIPDDPERPRHP